MSLQFILYCLCGGLGVATDYVIYFLSVTQGAWYQTANILGYLAGTLVSFLLNRIITFGMRDQVLRRLFLFLGVASIGYLASAALLWMLVDLISVDARWAKVLTLPLVVILQFYLNRRITFNVSKSTNNM